MRARIHNKIDLTSSCDYSTLDFLFLNAFLEHFQAWMDELLYEAKNFYLISARDVVPNEFSFYKVFHGQCNMEFDQWAFFLI
jgi:hypothetical protein